MAHGAIGRLVDNTQFYWRISMEFHFSRNKKQKGIGLIEVLIALVVVSIGLLALAVLQGDLMNSSGTNKARSEAISLAEQKLEEFKSSSTKVEYELIVDGDDGATIAGTNAIYTRTWQVTDIDSFTPSTNPKRKSLSINVAWIGGSRIC